MSLSRDQKIKSILDTHAGIVKALAKKQISQHSFDYLVASMNKDLEKLGARIRL